MDITWILPLAYYTGANVAAHLIFGDTRFMSENIATVLGLTSMFFAKAYFQIYDNARPDSSGIGIF